MTDKIESFVSIAHYAEHCWPVLQAIEPDLRGEMFAPRPVDAEVRALGIPCNAGTVLNSTAPLIVGGAQDLRYARRPKCLLQHGAGQTYKLPDGSPLESSSFAGGPGHDLADLFLCPSQRVADLELARYLKARAAVVGVPKLDEWITVPNPHNGVIAVTFHWNQRASSEVPEAGWAFPSWRETIEGLAKTRTIIGHAHPRAARELRPWWESIGVEFVPNAADLLPRAEVLIADSTSLAFEWAALDRPTVWLRGTDWNPDANHGLRFGEQLPGPDLRADLDPSVVSVGALVAAVEDAQGERWGPVRAEVAERVYGGFPDGRASVRAAQAILTLMG